MLAVSSKARQRCPRGSGGRYNGVGCAAALDGGQIFPFCQHLLRLKLLFGPQANGSPFSALSGEREQQ